MKISKEDEIETLDLEITQKGTNEKHPLFNKRCQQCGAVNTLTFATHSSKYCFLSHEGADLGEYVSHYHTIGDVIICRHCRTHFVNKFIGDIK